MDNFFKRKGCSTKKIELLKKKGFYLYNYVDNFKNFNEPRLPARRLWTNSLAGGEISVNPSEYNHASQVFSKFACRLLGEAFRSVCYETYQVDCAHNYTASNLSGDVFLKVCKEDLRLLTKTTT